MTNFEKLKEEIANMTVKEMAYETFLDGFICSHMNGGLCCGTDTYTCEECKLAFLTQEAEDGE